jgi:hypothetical protein
MDLPMKRARPALLGASLALILAGPLTAPARADCASDIVRLRAELDTVKDPHRREELQKLIDKAQKDNEAGRAELCGEAMERARTLLKG